MAIHAPGVIQVPPPKLRTPNFRTRGATIHRHFAFKKFNLFQNFRLPPLKPILRHNGHDYRYFAAKNGTPAAKICDYLFNFAAKN